MDPRWSDLLAALGAARSAEQVLAAARAGAGLLGVSHVELGTGAPPPQAWDRRSPVAHLPLDLPAAVPGAPTALVLHRRAARPWSNDSATAAEVLVALVRGALARSALHGPAGVPQRSTDALTGLPDRAAAEALLTRLMARGGTFAPVSVLLCDLNGLKEVNDTLGHGAGDRLLVETAALVARAAERLPSALAVRLGGDEFLVVSDGACEEDVAEVARWLVDAAAELPHGHGASCGSATVDRRPPAATTAEAAAAAVLRLADAAQYEHKALLRRRRSDLAAEAGAGAGAGAGAAPGAGSAAAPTAERQRALVEAVDELLGALPALAGTPARLQLVAERLTAVVGAVGWWLSEVDGPVLRLRAAGAARTASALEGLDDGVASSAAWPLADYPASAAAVRGGSFAVTLTSGDPAERQLIASTGYSAMIGAGGVDAAGRAWLVELAGDRAAASVTAVEPLLRLLVHAALTPAAPAP